MKNNRIKILLISNGYGEDNVAAHLGLKLKEIFPEFTVDAFPTVGKGKFYLTCGIQVVGHGPELPSEGFIRSFKDFIVDVLNGFFRKTLHMGAELRRITKNYDYLIAVGDPYILLFTSLFSNKPRTRKIFIGLQQSEWYNSRKPFKEHYSLIERIWLKKFAGLIFTRDPKTSDFLISKGVPNVFSFGNPMMDCFSILEDRIFPENKTVIGILPGSKKEAYDNLTKIFEVIKLLDKKIKDPIYAFAISPNLDIDTIVKRYNLVEITDNLTETSKDIKHYKLKGLRGEIVLSKSIFGNILKESKLIIGLSGTANEQAAGMGKAIFSFWGKGPQITEKFLKAQKRLLGPSLFLFPPEPELIANKIVEVIENKNLLKRIEENGKIRMYGRGSIEKIAKKIGSYISINSGNNTV